MNARPSPLDALKPIAGRALEIVFARLLALDPETRAALAKLEGKRVEMVVEAPPLALAITVRDGQLRVGPADASSEPDRACAPPAACSRNCLSPGPAPANRPASCA
jgi:ubiquinone biosynthesis protein UbiJ